MSGWEGVAVYQRGPRGAGGPECWLCPRRCARFDPGLSGGDAVTGGRGQGAGVSALLLIIARESTVTLSKTSILEKDLMSLGSSVYLTPLPGLALQPVSPVINTSKVAYPVLPPEGAQSSSSGLRCPQTLPLGLRPDLSPSPVPGPPKQTFISPGDSTAWCHWEALAQDTESGALRRGLQPRPVLGLLSHLIPGG